MAVLIFLGCLLGGIAIGLPIAWALLLCGAALMFWLDMFDVQIMAQTLVNGADSFSLLAIPFFVLAGEIMNAGGLSKRIVDLPMKLVGHKPGGLGYVGVLAAMIMASLSGSAVADTAAVAALLVPMMRSANYPVNRAAGLIASGGIIAPIIPPSIPFIIFGVSSGLSISKLFMAGIAPGMMMGATLMLTWWWQASLLNLPRQQKATMQEIWHSFVSGIWALFLPVIIIGGFRSGLFTPTEAGAVAAFYALFVATVIYREMTFATLWHVLIGAAKTTSVVMFLVASAQVSAWLITIAELPMMVSDLLQPLVDSPRLLFIVIMVAILIVGMVMDLTPTVLRSVTYALFIAGLAAFSTSSLAAQSLRFGYETSQTDSQHIAAKKFNDLLQERTKGELKLKLFPDSTLGNAQAMISGVRGGTIDMEMSGSNNFAGLSPVMNLLDVPFLFRDTAHAHKTLDGKVGDDLKASLEGKGLKVLAYWENGWRDVTNSRAPVKTPADLKGLKIRTNNSPMNIAAFKVFGANPIPMPFAEVYTGLETRTIDAQEHPINVVWSAKFFEVQKYLSLTHHAYSPLLVVINKAKFDGLTPEFQQALISSAQEAGSYQRKLVAEDQQKIIDGMKDAGVEVITDLDRKAFSDALGNQVRDMFIKDVPQGADLLKAVDEVQ
jgi:tripartite ATP-independent transporter DctM subunit/tripartite ATP-independent transporter DctP family solute receptor